MNSKLCKIIILALFLFLTAGLGSAQDFEERQFNEDPLDDSDDVLAYGDWYNNPDGYAHDGGNIHDNRFIRPNETRRYHIELMDDESGVEMVYELSLFGADEPRDGDGDAEYSIYSSGNLEEYGEGTNILEVEWDYSNEQFIFEAYNNNELIASDSADLSDTDVQTRIYFTNYQWTGADEQDSIRLTKIEEETFDDSNEELFQGFELRTLNEDPLDDSDGILADGDWYNNPDGYAHDNRNTHDNIVLEPGDRRIYKMYGQPEAESEFAYRLADEPQTEPTGSDSVEDEIYEAGQIGDTRYIYNDLTRVEVEWDESTDEFHYNAYDSITNYRLVSDTADLSDHSEVYFTTYEWSGGSAEESLRLTDVYDEEQTVIETLPAEDITDTTATLKAELVNYAEFQDHDPVDIKLVYEEVNTEETAREFNEDASDDDDGILASDYITSEEPHGYVGDNGNIHDQYAITGGEKRKYVFDESGSGARYVFNLADAPQDSFQSGSDVDNEIFEGGDSSHSLPEGKFRVEAYFDEDEETMDVYLYDDPQYGSVQFSDEDIDVSEAGGEVYFSMYEWSGSSGEDSTRLIDVFSTPIERLDSLDSGEVTAETNADQEEVYDAEATDLKEDAEYRFYSLAKDGDEVISQGEELTFTTLDSFIDIDPTNPVEGDEVATTVNLEADINSNVDGEAEFFLNGFSQGTQTFTENDDSIELEVNLDTGTYDYHIEAESDDGVDSESDTINFEVVGDPPEITQFQWKNPDAQLKEETRFEAEVIDPEYEVETVEATIWEGGKQDGTKILDSVEMTNFGEDWYETPKFELAQAETDYEAEVTYAINDQGASTNTEQQDITSITISADNSPPTINNMEFDNPSPQYAEPTAFQAELTDEEVDVDTSSIEFTIYEDGTPILEDNPEHVGDDIYQTETFRPADTSAEYTAQATFVEDTQGYSSSSEEQSLEPPTLHVDPLDITQTDEVTIEDISHSIKEPAETGETIEAVAEYTLQNHMDIEAEADIKNSIPEQAEITSDTVFIIDETSEQTKLIEAVVPVGNTEDVELTEELIDHPAQGYNQYTYNSTTHIDTNFTSQDKIKILEIPSGDLANFNIFEDQDRIQTIFEEEQNTETVVSEQDSTISVYVDTSSTSLEQGSHEFNITYSTETEVSSDDPQQFGAASIVNELDFDEEGFAVILAESLISSFFDTLKFWD